MQTRPPNEKELSRWEAFKKRVSLADKEILLGWYTRENVRILQMFAAENGIILERESDIDIDFLRKLVNRQIKLIKAVESGELLVRMSENDIDIMGRPGMTSDEKTEYQNLGWIILVGVGIVIVAAILTENYLLRQRNKSAWRLNNKIMEDANKKFCADPNNPVCQKWLDRKERSGYDKNLTTMETIKGWLKKTGDSLVVGSKWGTAALIPIIAIGLFLKYGTKK